MELRLFHITVNFTLLSRHWSHFSKCAAFGGSHRGPLVGVADDEVMIFSFADSTPRAQSPHINPNPEPHFHQNNHWITPANWPNGKASDYDSNRHQEIAGSSPALVKVECVCLFFGHLSHSH